MVIKAERERKNSNAEFGRMMDQSVTHLRVGQGQDNTRVTLLMTAAYAHSLDGVCTCCPRRPAGEPTGRDIAAAAAREAAARPPARPALIGADVPLVVDQLRAGAIAQARAAAQHSAEQNRRD